MTLRILVLTAVASVAALLAIVGHATSGGGIASPRECERQMAIRLQDAMTHPGQAAEETPPVACYGIPAAQLEEMAGRVMEKQLERDLDDAFSE